ncbi:MAG: TrkH family potassium uptake protein [Paracoccaceae bacterium]
MPTRLLRSLPPPAVLVLLYAALIALGAVLLLLPIAHHVPVTPMQALFTAVSAVTVTGLSLIDTGSEFTLFGQVVIAGLIQLGGLGLMSFAVLILSALGIRIALPERHILREDLNQTSISNLLSLVRVLLLFSLLAEALGTLILAFAFVPDRGWAEGLWFALFHAVSAFNNAGFSLYPDSLMRFVGDPLVNLAIPALFLSGGLGFVVIADIARHRSWRRLSLHSKLMLSGSAVLIALGFVGVAALEWTNPATLGGLPDTATRLWAAWFQAVTPRTAGFNSIDTGAMHDSTALLTMVLMVIGGGSASTAGGIKVTTAIVMLLATIAFFRRRAQLTAFGHSLGTDEVMKVLALAVVSFLVVTTGLFVASVSHDGDFLDLMFEVTSAFGTAGLSRGATPLLDSSGQIAIMAIMFIGRVGPLTLGFFLARRRTPRVRYPAGQIYLG